MLLTIQLQKLNFDIFIMSGRAGVREMGEHESRKISQSGQTRIFII